MDKTLFVANWKSHKLKDEGIHFFQELARKIEALNLESQQLVVAPPSTLLSKMREIVDEQKMPVLLAGQNVSSYPQGAYTGEINAKQLREFAEFVIIGHSERRRYLHESESDIENKIREATEAGLRVIQCVQDENGLVYTGVEYAAYEPVSAIGTGNPDDPKHVEEVFSEIHKKRPDAKLLYGGSVSADNINQYKSIQGIKGFLVGGASLDVDSFVSLLS